MPYIPVPKDLTKVKSKVLFNLTRRPAKSVSVARENARAGQERGEGQEQG